jgi:hypothetical protein
MCLAYGSNPLSAEGFSGPSHGGGQKVFSPDYSGHIVWRIRQPNERLYISKSFSRHLWAAEKKQRSSHVITKARSKEISRIHASVDVLT